jgi:DNA adenine methylase
MARTHSPLRYPGGKSCLYDLTSTILRLNKLERGDYAEPYAGGGGLALTLMFNGHVADIHINDLDPSIWSFWHSILNETHAFTSLIEETPVTLDEWHRQRQIHLDQDTDDILQLGFSTFFLNRTNRSGIIKGASVIGGLDQTGNYKLDCRFNKPDLIRRIERIEKYKSRIHLTRLDALKFLKQSKRRLPDHTFFCIDPPYFNKGKNLYTSAYSQSDHEDVAKAIVDLDRPWIVTYDDTPEIRKHYKTRRQYCFDINYSLQTKRIGTELLIASKGLRLPGKIRDRQVHKPQHRRANSTA